MGEVACTPGQLMVAPSFEYYYKPMKKGGAKTAVLMMNNGHQLMGKDGGKLESPSYHNHGHSGTTPPPVDQKAFHWDAVRSPFTAGTDDASTHDTASTPGSAPSPSTALPA